MQQLSLLQDEDAGEGIWLTIFIVIVAFNITTCVCCVLKRNSWTMVSSRHDIFSLAKSIPGDAISACYAIIPCIIALPVYIAWTACCCKGCFKACIAANRRSRIVPADAHETVNEAGAENISSWRKPKFLTKLRASTLFQGTMRQGVTREDGERLAHATISASAKALAHEKGGSDNAQLNAPMEAEVEDPTTALHERRKVIEDDQQAAKELAAKDSHVINTEMVVGEDGWCTLNVTPSPKFRENDAAVTVQSAARGKKGMKEAKKKKAQKRNKEVSDAATKVQSAARGKKAKKEKQVLAEEKQEKVETNAATTVQSAARGKKAKKEKRQLAEEKQEKQEKQEDAAATTMQSAARGKKAKKQKQKLVEEKQEKEDDDAATVLQAGARMQKAKSEKKALKQDKQENDAATALQAAARGKTAKKEKQVLKQDKEENEAAVIVQAAARGKKAKGEKKQLKQEQTERNAATKVQSGVRMKVAKEERKLLQQDKEENAAAVKLQAGARGRAAKSERNQLVKEKKDTEAATVVQAGARVAKAKSEKKRLAVEKALPAAEKKQRNEAAAVLQKQAKEKRAGKVEKLKQLEQAKRPKSAAERSQAATVIQSKKRANAAKAATQVLHTKKVRDQEEAKEEARINLEVNVDDTGAPSSPVRVMSKTRSERLEQRQKLEGKIASVEKKLETEQKSKAATKVQTKVRGNQAKSAKDVLAKEHQKKQEQGAALTVQTAARGHKARQERKDLARDKQEVKAATAIQNRTRVSQAKATKDVLAKEKTEKQAATVVQSRQRMRSAQSERALLAKSKVDGNAATLVQSRVRSHQAKSERDVRAKAKQDATEAAAATSLQSRARSHQAKKTREVLAREKSERVAATAVQSRVRGHQAKVLRADLEAQRHAAIEKEQADAATRVQSQVRVTRAKSERSARLAARAANQERAATVVQAQVRGQRARQQSGLLQAELSLPESERENRAKAATRLASNRRAQTARQERANRRTERDRKIAERHEAVCALQSIIRVRKARAQRRQLEAAAELAETLGISKWAALWMLRESSEDEKPIKDESTPQVEEETGGLWTNLKSGSLPEAPAPLEYPPSEDGLSVEEDPPVEAAAPVDETSLEVPDAPEPKLTRNRHWQLLASNLELAVLRMYESRDIQRPNEASGVFAQAAKQRLAQMHQFRERNASYPHGPLPQFGDAVVHSRDRRPSSRGVVQQVPGMHDRQGTPLAYSRSEASLLNRPVTVDGSPPWGHSLNQPSVPDRRLPQIAARLPQYGESMRMLEPAPIQRDRAFQAPPRRPAVAWGDGDVATNAASSHMQDNAKLAAPTQANASNLREVASRSSLSSATRRCVQRFQISEPSYPQTGPIRASPSLQTLGPVGRRGKQRSPTQRRRSPTGSSPPRDTPQRTAPSRPTTLRPIARKNSSERIATRADRRPTRMPGAPPAAADPFPMKPDDEEDADFDPSRPDSSQTALRESTHHAEVPSQSLRSSASQLELLDLRPGPVGVQFGPSLLSEMPLPFAIGQGSSSSGLALPARRNSNVIMNSQQAAVQASGYQQPRPGTSGGLPTLPVSPSAPDFTRPNTTQGLPDMSVGYGNSLGTAGPAYGEQRQQRQAPSRGSESRRHPDRSPPRTYFVDR